MSTPTPGEQEIFHVACEITSEEARQAYIDHVCGEDEELKKRVQTLLRVDAEQGLGNTNNYEALDTTEVLEKAVGPYKLLQQIGEGGMGTVYMAEQTKPIQRTVALKIIKPGMDSDLVIARFEAERQALAMMDHPNIAKVLDAGTTEGQRPYFVMELVKGMPITQYCDDHRLNASERLRLFAQACHGVQHAHLKGVIHRDLKPTNVLVAEYDHQAVPKIIDFGVAKAISQKLTEKTMYTQFGQIVGTLDYMSPEQAKFNQLDIDTRSDIYSLGVLLYELLTGETPIDRDRLKTSGLEEILRIIREEEPKEPSTRLSTSTELPALAANRNTSPDKLAGQLREDLDWIVIKALSKERGERYQTAEALANDVDRHLNDEPVEAHRPSYVGRSRRFIRRHKLAVSMSALVLVACCVAGTLGVIAYVGALRQSQQQADLDATKSDLKLTQTLAERRAWARNTALPKLQQLIDDKKPLEAFQLGSELRGIIQGDPAFEAMWDAATVTASFEIQPAGTTVSYRDAYLRDEGWTEIGETPLVDVILPRGELRFRYSKDGFYDFECQRHFPGNYIRNFQLQKEREDDPHGMTLISAGSSGIEQTGSLERFWIDTYEVTNEMYQEFVDAAGYQQPNYWRDMEFSREGATVGWEEAMKSFVDATGRNGPAVWLDGKFPEGKAHYPVRGVSWFEAKAYAEFCGKSLPTIHHWKRAARADQTWILSKLSNFSTGPMPRGSHFGLGHFPVYDLAGNVKEWCWNEVSNGNRCILGAAWNEPDYEFQFVHFASPWDRDESHGFRCVRYSREEGPESRTLQPWSVPSSELAAMNREPIDSLLTWYQYDRDLPLNARVIQDDDKTPSPDFRHEVVRINAAYGDESFSVHLLIPREHKRKYETIVIYPGLGSFQKGGQFSPKSGWMTRFYEEFIKSGRMVCQPEYKQTFERWDGNRYLELWRTAPIQARDRSLAIAKDVFRTVDYLLTRDDVDSNRLIYYGQSYGSLRAPPILAAEQRFAAAVLQVGGYRFTKTGEGFPELNGFQFTPHVKTPVLMVNGLADTVFPFDTAQVPMFEDLGSETKRHVVQDGVRHNVNAQDMAREMDDWLGSLFRGEETGVEPAEIPSVDEH